MDKKQQLSDHDLIVRLDTKMDQLSVDVKDLKDGTSATLSQHESRIAAIERVHDEVNPLQALKQIREVAEEQHDFKIVWKFIIALAIGLSSAITLILSSIFQILHIFSFGK